MTLEETLKQIKPLNEEKNENSQKTMGSIAQASPFPWKNGRSDYADRWNYRGRESGSWKKGSYWAICADNGVVEEGLPRQDRKSLQL